uniref:Copia-like retrotransposon n=1 Tax=Tanacetum cinerariifolium TaxID=118510 RepID=A0A6L2MXE5_TANCI|nr:copia-like retrotransposon [Tanacetum cinerariifolium]
MSMEMDEQANVEVKNKKTNGKKPQKKTTKHKRKIRVKMKVLAPKGMSMKMEPTDMGLEGCCWCWSSVLQQSLKVSIYLEMDAGASSSNLRIMNQEFVKLDKFDGCNYTRWADKMKFLLIVLKVFYVLDPLLALIRPIPLLLKDKNPIRMKCRA